MSDAQSKRTPGHRQALMERKGWLSRAKKGEIGRNEKQASGRSGRLGWGLGAEEEGKAGDNFSFAITGGGAGGQLF